MRFRALIAVVGVVAAVATCREGPSDFEAAAREITATSPTRLTFNAGPDVTPSWSSNSDTVYYSGRGFDIFPSSEGLLFAVPRTGGSVRLVEASVQSFGGRYLLAPAVSRNGQRVAFFEAVRIGLAACFDVIRYSCVGLEDQAITTPRMILGARMHVRAANDVGNSAEDPRLELKIPFADTVGTEINSRVLPFHLAWDTEGRPFYRPSWAPDNNRVAYSDGGVIRIWTVGGAAQGVPVPNTEDGIEVAWSPDGQWLAYSRPTGSVTATRRCTMFSQTRVECTENRTFYTPTGNVLTVIRPDGTGKVELGEGVEPSWGPDSRTLYFRRGVSIWRTSRDGSTAAAPVAGLQEAMQPSVSPDGKYIAYLRFNAQSKDIWVASLSQ